MPGLFGSLFGGNRLRARDVAHSTVIVGDTQGLVISNEPPPAPPSLPWDPLPKLDAQPGEIDIFKLLTWRVRLTATLVGRDADRDGLLAWARTGPPVAIRLLAGPGGAGKTRLANEVATTLRDEGWSSGAVSLTDTTRLPLGETGAFIIIDYPEEARDPVRAVLKAAGRLDMPGPKLRLLLLSRRSLDFWQSDIIAAGAINRCDSQAVALGPLDAVGTAALVRHAVARLAPADPPVLDEAAIAAWHASDPALHGLPLFATAAAIHAVLDPAQTFSLAGRDIIRALVLRERRRLDEAAHGADWPEPEAASRLHGLAALCRSLDEATLRRLAREAPEIGLPPPERAVDAVARLGWLRAGALPAPQPDLVAADLLNQILADRPQAAPDWLAATLADPDALDIDRLGRLAHDIAILHAESAPPLAALLAGTVNRRPALARIWRVVLDSETSFRLIPLAIGIASALLREAELDERERAAVFSNLSNHLGNAGDNAALAAIRDAVAILRRLATADPARFEPDLAGSLNNLSLRLSDAGDNTTALKAIREAIAIRRRLATADPARFEPDLARSLVNLSIHLRHGRDSTAALDVIQEAVRILRRLARTNPARCFEPDLARSLHSLSNSLREAGDNTAALDAIRDAVAILRRLASADPARFEPELATSLNNLSLRLSDAGDNTAALKAIRKAVATHRRFASANPARFQRDLDRSLATQAIVERRAGPAPAAL